MSMISLADSVAGLFPNLPQATPTQPSERTIRARDRAARWRADLTRHFHQLEALVKTDDERAQLEAAFAKEMKQGPDFARVRREATNFAPAPKISGDRNELARLLFILESIARGTWKADRAHAKDKRRKITRTIAASVIPVLRSLIRLATKHNGRVFPSYEGLAIFSCLSRSTAIAAIKTLEAFGFITVTRRCKRVQTPLGIRMVQDTNAYTLHAPRGLGAMAMKIFGISSECKKQPARDSNNNPTSKEAIQGSKNPPPAPRQWEIEPLPDAFHTPKRRIQWWELIRN